MDAKLARSAKARAVLQTAFYSHLLARLQPAAPRWMHLALGHGEFAPFKVDDFAAYERQTRRLLEAAIGGDPEDPEDPEAPEGEVYPEPVEHCAICRWRDLCRERRRADDDLSLVAGMPAGPRRALKEAGISTRRGFAGRAGLPRLDRVSPGVLRDAQRQARLQVASEDGGVDTAEADEAGLPRYTQIWAFDRPGEKRAFEELIDFITERRARLPACTSTREDEVDGLFRLGCSSTCTGWCGRACAGGGELLDQAARATVRIRPAGGPGRGDGQPDRVRGGAGERGPRPVLAGETEAAGDPETARISAARPARFRGNARGAGAGAAGRPARLAPAGAQRFRFPPQEHKFSAGAVACDPATDRQWSICAVDDAHGTIGVKMGSSYSGPWPSALVEACLRGPGAAGAAAGAR